MGSGKQAKKRIYIRVTDFEDARIRETAGALGLTLADYIARQCIYIDGIHESLGLGPVAEVDVKHAWRNLDRRDKTIAVWLREDEREAIVTAAARVGLSISDYVAHRCVYASLHEPATPTIDGEERCEGPLPPDLQIARALKDAWLELNRQGVNLNQIAHAANTIALDTRSRKSLQLARELRQLVRETSPALREALIGIGEARAAIRTSGR